MLLAAEVEDQTGEGREQRGNMMSGRNKGERGKEQLKSQSTNQNITNEFPLGNTCISEITV